MSGIEKMSNANNIQSNDMKLATFRLKYNSKNPSGEWSKGNLPHAKRIRSLEKMELLKDDYNNFGVICGKANDLTIVDLDFYDHGDDKFDPRMSVFHSVFGEDFVKRFNTFTVKTGSGGYHLYFKYINKIKQTSDKTSSIDIRNDGGYAVAPYSNINDKRYIVDNMADIKPMPQELIDWLLGNIYPASKKKERNPKVKVKKVNPETNVEEEVEVDQDDIDLGVYKFAVPKSLVEECLCKGLPDKFFHEYAYWLKYTTAMKTLDMKPLWDKYNKIRCKKDKNKGNLADNWDGIVDHNKLDMLTHVLNQSTVENAINLLGYFKYKPTECHNEIPTDFINREKLGYKAVIEFKEDGTKILVFRSDTGTGKTTTMKHHLKDTGSRFLSIVSRISLGEEQTAVFKAHGIDCKYHQEIQDEIDEHNAKSGHFCMFDGFDDKEGDNIVITIDSLTKLDGWQDFYGYTVYLDEYNSLIEHLITSPTCSKKRAPIFHMLRKIITEADLVICTDADISDNCLQVFKQMGMEYRFIDNQYKHNNNVKATEITDFDRFMNKLMAEPKFILCADSKTIVDVMGHKTFKKTGGDVKVITSETSGRVDLDAHDRVLYSPKIVYGLDSVMKRPVFAYFCQHTITPVAMVQQICRCRDITSITFMFEPMGCQAYMYHDMDEIKEEVVAMDKLSADFGMIDGLKDDYLDLYARFEYNYDCFNTNKKAHFIQILKNRGVKITLSMDGGGETDPKALMTIKKEVKMAKKGDMTQWCKVWMDNVMQPYMDEELSELEEEYENEEKDGEYEDRYWEIKNTGRDHHKWHEQSKEYYPEWVWRKNEILQIPYADIHNHFDLFTKPAELEQHLMASNFFFKTDLDLMDEITDSKDFGVKKLKSNRGKLILMRKYMNMTTHENQSKFVLPLEADVKPLTKEQNEKYMTEYNLIYRSRRKNPEDLTDQHQAYLHYINHYKRFVDVEKKSTSKDSKKLVIYSLIKDAVKYHQEIIEYRKPVDDDIKLVIDGM